MTFIDLQRTHRIGGTLAAFASIVAPLFITNIADPSQHNFLLSAFCVIGVAALLVILNPLKVILLDAKTVLATGRLFSWRINNEEATLRLRHYRGGKYLIAEVHANGRKESIGLLSTRSSLARELIARGHQPLPETQDRSNC